MIPGGEGLRWSAWAPFAKAMDRVPREPGVYVARDQTTKKFVYVGHAGPRDSSGRKKPEGLRGRLVDKYAAGKAATSGLGAAAMDRALRDPIWLRRRLEAVEAGVRWRTTDWATAALIDAGLELSWTVCSDKETAKELERHIRGKIGLARLWSRI